MSNKKIDKLYHDIVFVLTSYILVLCLIANIYFF